MSYTTLVAPAVLAEHLEDSGWVVVDCRFASHIPGAVYAHLDDDLSGSVVAGLTGRHPLPTPEQLAQTLGAWGIGNRTQVVAYDDANGSYAARLWWTLRWLGHRDVAVLDGGWAAWTRGGFPVSSSVQARVGATFVPEPQPQLVADVEAVEQMRQDTAFRVVDSRALERYRGEHEPIDPVAGHIPGAVCVPFGANVNADGTFRTPEELRERFGLLTKVVPADRTVFYCGSGVTAAHNVLAYAHAGLGDARLYPGSWSEWIADPARPVGRGDPS
jgi:thiosulfate/3-mercaptopyruvate sulfurtransferase